MNMAIADINNYGNLRWYERAARHSRFNKYTLYVLHAHRAYRHLSSETKINLIRSIPGLADNDVMIDDFNYTSSIVVNAYYRHVMDAPTKAAWTRRANFLNSRPQPGQFAVLPPQVVLPDFNRKILQIECKQFSTMMRRALTSDPVRDASHQEFKLPYLSVVETQSLRQTHVSNQLLFLMFGPTFRENSREHEIHSNRRFPVYLHYFSAQRIVQVLTILDCHFGTYQDLQNDHTYQFSSYCVLAEANSTRTFKAYGVSEDEFGFIVFKYNNTGNNEASLVRLRRPVFSSDGKGYDFSQSYTSAFHMVEFYPTIIYLTQEHYRNFIFMSPRLCTNNEGLVVECNSS